MEKKLKQLNKTLSEISRSLKSIERNLNKEEKEPKECCLGVDVVDIDGSEVTWASKGNL
ncbi:hypothetical protein [Thalassobacillus sp. C254]|uniref:hypothetical protein n=1 Tax=Thalassobacillus sp. C254 TaxID=1225341 RepID=UPI0012ED09AC|nr:hypothetical protein [Thalassobacillus sp. C254]